MGLIFVGVGRERFENSLPHGGFYVFFFFSLSIDIFFKDGVSKFLAQVHMRPKRILFA